MGNESLRPLSRVSNVVAAAGGGYAIARPSSMGARVAGAGLALNGVNNLVNRDALHTSVVASSAQVLGGITLTVAKNPETATRGAVVGVAGTLVNLVDAHISSDDHPVLKTGLKSGIVTGAAGAVLAGRETSIPGMLTMAVIGGVFGAMWKTVSQDDGPRPMTTDQVRLGLALRSRYQ